MYYSLYSLSLLFGFCSTRDFLNLSLICSSSHSFLKSIIERNVTFKIPHSMKMNTLSPQNAIVSSPHSIPSNAIKLTLVVFNWEHYNDFLPFYPPTLTHVVMKHYDGDQSMLPSTLTQLITEYDFNQPVDNLPPLSLTLPLDMISTNQLITFLPLSPT
jgi:hypothetical protein